MPLYMVAIWEMGRVAYQRSMIVGSYKLAFLAILVVITNVYLGASRNLGMWHPKDTPVHGGVRNDTTISSVVHHVGQEGKVVNRSHPVSPLSWRCWPTIRRNIN